MLEWGKVNMIKNPEVTKNKMIEAFLQSYKYKRIEQITIGEITKKANVNRGTFYYYYKDVYDLMEHIEQQIFEGVVERIGRIIECIINSHNTEGVAIVANEFLQDYRELAMLFIVDKPNLILQRKIKERGKQILLKQLGISEEHLSIEQKYLHEYVASAQFGLISYWLAHNQDMTPTQLAKVMEMANLKGAVTSMRQLVEV